MMIMMRMMSRIPTKAAAAMMVPRIVHDKFDSVPVERKSDDEDAVKVL